MILINCPHCNQLIEIIELNCCIFRCGITKNTFQQIDPHLSKNECMRLIKDELIYGCGKPFKVQLSKNGTILCVQCEYI